MASRVTDLSLFGDLPASEQQVLLEGPALNPPPGILSNLVNPTRHDSLGYGVLLTVSVIATLLVSGQLYTRIKYERKLYMEDYVAVAALGAYATYVYFCWTGIIDPGLMIHQWNIKLKQLPHLLYSILSGSSTYNMMVMTLKVGILIQWLRIFVPRGVRDAFYYTCHATIWINVVFYTLYTLLSIFGCNPIEKRWTPWAKGKCIMALSTPKGVVVAAFINFISDIIIILLPQAKIWRLNMSMPKKIGTATLFAVGLLGTACAGVRIKLCLDYAHSQDFAYGIGQLALCGVAEMLAGFLILCSPTLPRLVSGSEWIQKVIKTFKILRSRFTGRTYVAEDAPKSLRSWPRFKPRRDPDASLFSTTSDTALVSLQSVHVNSNKDDEIMPTINNIRTISPPPSYPPTQQRCSRNLEGIEQSV